MLLPTEFQRNYLFLADWNNGIDLEGRSKFAARSS